MHRLLLSRVCRGSYLISGLGTGVTVQVWEETTGLLCLSRRSSARLSSSRRDLSTDRGPLHPSEKPSQGDLSSTEKAGMEHRSKNSAAGKSKRTREFVSPLRPTGPKKKIKDKEYPSSKPLLICLDDIPLPSQSLPGKKDAPPLDFIPLPPSPPNPPPSLPSPPPPLPPPLPSPPPPPSHSEMDEVLDDFFMIDTTASGPLFPVPLPPGFVSDNINGDAHSGASSSTPVPPTYNIDSDPDEIVVVDNSDTVLHDQFKNINLIGQKKNVTNNTSVSSTNSDQIDIVFEGQRPAIVSSPGTSHIEGSSCQDLLRKRTNTFIQQIRNCHHFTNHGLKTVEKSPEPEMVQAMGSADPDIITLDSSTNDVMGIVGPEEFISLNTSQNSAFEEGEEEIINIDSSSKKAKKRKSKKKAKKGAGMHSQDSLDTSHECPTAASDREVSPDIQKVGVLDPDVVEIDQSFPSTSHSAGIEDMEVVDVYDSDSGSENFKRTPSVCEDNLEVVDVSESDRESVSSSGQGQDISNDEFIALGRTRPERLENTEIDIDDAVLDRRSKLEEMRQWRMTRLGEEVLLHSKVRKNDIVFSLMSYNVLAQQLLWDNRFLYSSCDERHLYWKYRWALLQYEVEDLSPDVLLLQEVQASHYYSHFLPWLTFKGYDGLYKKRTGDKCDGCAIFFKKEKFSLVESCSVEYLQPKAKKVLDRDNIGLIAKLAPVTSPELNVCVATTHFLYNPRRHDVKLAQAILLLTELDRICYQNERNGVVEYCPVILSGDFNSEPHSALLDMFKEGRLHYEGLSTRTLTQHGTFPVLSAELIPPSLGITERCQHAVLAQSRFVEKTSGQLFSLSDKRKIEDSLIRMQNTDRSHKRLKGVTGGSHGPAPTGWYSHSFHFNSVYRHYAKKAAEATTFHNKWTTVDYILYSRLYADNHGQAVEGPLKLLARYGLLTGPEAKKFAPLPSAVCPSDHFPLAAQFLLRRK